MSQEGFDRRITPARGDLAAAHLRGQVDAAAFVDPVPMRVAAATAPLRPEPTDGAVPDTELLYGEQVDVFERDGDWAWLQSKLDGYVGYAHVATLENPGASPTHRITTLSSSRYPVGNLKVSTQGRLPFGARVAITSAKDRYAQTDDGFWLPVEHLAALDAPAEDWVAVAEGFLGVPYLWGGRSSWGLDCSALVQLSRQAAGYACPRDSDMQASSIGETLPDNATPQRGDLMFWRGHVGIMSSETMLLHANAHHMAVRAEPLADALARIAQNEFGEVTRRARL